MSIFSKLVQMVSGGKDDGAAPAPDRAQEQLLVQTLEPLRKVNAQFPARILAFILHGTDETVLLDLQNAKVALPHSNGFYLGSPGRLRWQFNRYDDKELNKLGTQSLAARRKFYASVNQAKAPLAAIVRLGKILAATDAGDSLEHPGAPVPDWLQYVVNDVCYASQNDYRNEFEKLATGDAVPTGYWGIDLFAQLLAEDGLNPLLALQVAFERKGIDSYYYAHLAVLLKPKALGQMMLAHAEAVNSLPAQLSAAGRTLLAHRVGTDTALVTVFAPLMMALATDNSKGVRTEAGLHLSAIDATVRLNLLGAMLNAGSTAERGQAADLLARMQDSRATALLEAALANAPSKSVEQALRAALSRVSAAGDTTTIDLSGAPPWVPFAETKLTDSALALLKRNYAELLERARLAADAEAVSADAIKYKWKWARDHYKNMQKMTDSDLQVFFAAVNGTGTPAKNTKALINVLVDIFSYERRIEALPEFGITQIIRMHALSNHWGGIWGDSRFQKWLAKQPQGSLDLRALAEALFRARVAHPNTQVAQACLRPSWQVATATQLLPANCVWPFFAEHPELIDEGLGLTASTEDDRYSRYELGETLSLLAVFPSVPPRWLPRLMELALGEAKTHRAAAQNTLVNLPDIGQRVLESLSAAKSEVRIEAANWLANLQYKPAIAALTKALDKETRETVRAAFLTALEALGDDISLRLAPDILLAEAQKGLKARPPAGLDWFKFESLPECQWNDATTVAPEILRWWVVLSCKLKEPGGNALLSGYLGLLAPQSRGAFGSTVLQSFIAQDTAGPDLAAGIAFAQAESQNRWQGYQDQYNNAKAEYKEYYIANFNKTKDQVFEECKRDKMSVYFGSAIGEKGILALTAYAPPHEAVNLLQQYMRDHYQRRAQIEAMLDGITIGNDPLVIQLLLGISRRYRTASVQEKARGLVQKIADTKNWTHDQLADRTTPTAGLDDTGKLELAYGERTFTLVLDAAMKPELRNAEGKVVKALPEPRQNDDAASIKDAKSQLSTTKKELKQVIDSQTARLVEAMCAGRLWPQTEWREYLHAHPIVGRLIQQLVWLEVDENNAVRASFRPSEDGSLINTDDDEVTLAADSVIRLAHASLLPEGSAAAWLKHFKDYKVTPLFGQMTRQSPSIAFTDKTGADVTLIEDHLGWMSDSFTLRGGFTKLGYQRAAAEDGGFFYQYTKRFESVGVTVTLEFSGNCLPEENVPAALKTLSFEDSKSKSWSDRTMPLKNVPPVLLAEAYADYLAVAKMCAGFDAEWEKKLRW